MHFGHENMLAEGMAKGLGPLLVNSAKWASSKGASIRLSAQSSWGAALAASLANVGGGQTQCIGPQCLC